MRVGLLLGCLLFSASAICSDEIIFNEVKAVVFGPEQETVVISTLDIRPSLTGEPRTLRDLILEQLKLFDARTLHITVSNEDVDKYIKELQKMNNCGIEQIEGLFKALGWTMQEGREQLKRKEEIDQEQHYRLRNKIAPIKPGDVEAYWQEHGERQEATFTLITAFVPSEQPLDEFTAAVKNKTLKQSISWNAPFTVKAQDLAADKQFIKGEQGGAIVLVEPVSGGFEITKLKDKTEDRLLPLYIGDPDLDQKRVKEIEAIIRQQRYKSALAEFEAELLEKAKNHIKFMHEADRRAVYGI